MGALGSFRGALLVALLLVCALPSAAQIPDPTPSGGADTSGLADAIRAAAEAGVSVVVVDAAGNLVGTSARTEAAPGSAMEGGSGLMKAQEQVAAFRHTLRERLDALPNSLNEVAYILRATSPDGRIMTYVEVVLWSLAFFVLSRWLTSEIYGKRIARRHVVGRIKDAPEGYREKMPFLLFRFVAGIGGTLFSMLLAYLMGIVFLGAVDDISVEFTITAIFLAFFLARTVSDLWRMVLSPFLPQYRIPRLSDRDAKRLFYWTSTLATLDISVYVFATWLFDFGLNYNVYAIVYGALSLVVTILNVVMILVNRRAISNAIAGGRPRDEQSWLLRAVCLAWAPVLIGYVLFGWLELAFDLVLEYPAGVPLLAGAYGVLILILVVYGGMNYAIERYFHLAIARDRLNREASGDAAARDEGASRSIQTYRQLARRVAGILAFVAGSYAMLRIWDPENAVIGETWVGRLLDVFTILFIGYVIYQVFRIWIDNKIAEEAPEGEEAELGDEGGAGGASRLGTLLPLFRGAILAVVVVAIGLIALLELGINVSPLFAGAGVVGLAVGFGAQTLVRDIFSGAFFLIDDAFRKGEYIDIGGVKGTVEKISVRSFQLRHHLGALNTIPFGEIQVLTNYSRDWVIMKLPLRVTYDTDVEKVRKLIKKLGQDLLSDPVIGENFIQPLKSQGVIEMQDSAMIIRVKFMTKPGDQWLVRKRVYEDIRELFAREGIKFAHREVTVRLADGKFEDLDPRQREALSGAVREIVDEEDFDADGPMGADDR